MSMNFKTYAPSV